MNKKRIFYVEWSHACDNGARMSHIFTEDNEQELFRFFSNEEDPIVYFAFQDITDLPIEEFERKLTYCGKYPV